MRGGAAATKSNNSGQRSVHFVDDRSKMDYLEDDKSRVTETTVGSSEEDDEEEQTRTAVGALQNSSQDLDLAVYLQDASPEDIEELINEFLDQIQEKMDARYPGLRDETFDRKLGLRYIVDGKEIDILVDVLDAALNNNNNNNNKSNGSSSYSSSSHNSSHSSSSHNSSHSSSSSSNRSSTPGSSIEKKLMTLPPENLSPSRSLPPPSIVSTTSSCSSSSSSSSSSSWDGSYNSSRSFMENQRLLVDHDLTSLNSSNSSSLMMMKQHLVYHDLVRSVKKWRDSVQWEDDGCTPSTYLIEILMLEAFYRMGYCSRNGHVHGTERSILWYRTKTKLLVQFYELVASVEPYHRSQQQRYNEDNLPGLFVWFSEYYDQSDLPLSRSRPLFKDRYGRRATAIVVDPVNPRKNLWFTLKNPVPFLEAAKEALKILR